MAANDRQVGGTHYKTGGEEHWDRAWRLKYDPFQYIITKWVERWRKKGGLEDLYKARHALDKYIELVEREGKLAATDAEVLHTNGIALAEQDGSEPTSRGYVNQD